jgi:hypothetical protein
MNQAKDSSLYSKTLQLHTCQVQTEDGVEFDPHRISQLLVNATLNVTVECWLKNEAL